MNGLTQLLRPLLSNRARPFLLPVLLLSLVLFYVEFGMMLDERLLTVAEALQEPGEHRGEVAVVNFGRLHTVARDHLEIESHGIRYRIEARPPPAELIRLAPNTVVSLRGRVEGDGRLRLIEFRIHSLRWLKWLVGGLTLVTILAAWVWDRLRPAAKTPGGGGTGGTRPGNASGGRGRSRERKPSRA